MGMLVDGVWRDDDKALVDDEGRLQRPSSVFRNWVTADGAPGPSGDGGFAAEPGRYHLYIARACPWAHRAAIFRELKGLQDMVGLSVTHWLMAEDGWTFTDGPGVIPDSVEGADTVWQLYVKSDPRYTGRVTVPVLWDTHTSRVVSNESADIIRMFNSAFDAVGATPGDFYPEALRGEIDAVNDRVYDGLNNGVYKAGFAKRQAAYDEAVAGVFDTLDWLEARLSAHEYLVGDTLTEADWRLFTTLLRFDAVYHGHFKCNRRRIVDYPALWAYTRRLYAHPAVAPTVDMDHIKRHYYQSHRHINPTGIVPAGPALDFSLDDDAPSGAR
ncbi:glutathione S-transferase family protein [Luteimonas sp BLCC-B24]|uniref:glutathione S-transferase family protein n=1 Tax=Luteimonas sp. BLCC-B24 TaxID=3025317 RepID=UPI00234D6522|nr:glutathione S-transferase family protein [Luteimonas sp. BLCC-B24]MDC7807189.1 glutathione S-transferase family protein [Luteimonas sp. BLCC-B24]